MNPDDFFEVTSLSKEISEWVRSKANQNVEVPTIVAVLIASAAKLAYVNMDNDKNMRRAPIPIEPMIFQRGNSSIEITKE